MSELRICAELLLPLVKENRWAKFAWIMPPTLNHLGSVYTDASGEGEGYGIGVFAENMGAFQCKRELYAELLIRIFQGSKNPLHIMYQELLGYLLAVWYLCERCAEKTSGKHVCYTLDNSTVFYNAGKSSFRGNLPVNLLLLRAGELSRTVNLQYTFEWVPTERMANYFWADKLSRELVEYSFEFKGRAYFPKQLTKKDIAEFAMTF